MLGDRGRKLGYVLSRKGRSTVGGSDFRAGFLGGKRARYRTTCDHDLIVREVRGILETSPLVSGFKSEDQIRSALGLRGRAAAKAKVPDGWFVLSGPEGELKVALQVEIAQKSRTRYEDLVSRLRFQASADATLILYSQPHPGALPRLLQQPFDTLFFDRLLDVVEVLPANTKSATCVADIAECCTELNDIELATNDILISGHGFLVW